MAAQGNGRGFVLALASSVVLLIPLWALVGVYETEAEGEEAHHAGAADARAIEAFRERVEAFVERFEREDGCVAPTRVAVADQMPAATETEAEHAEAGEPGEVIGHGETEEHAEAGGHDPEEEVPVVYLEAFRFGYTPSELCLEAGRTYEFRMMATDVIHGASINLGAGSMMVRLPPGVMVETRVTFTEPGEHLLYCSYYCGLGHQFMQGRIVVEPAQSGEPRIGRPAGETSGRNA